MSASATVNRDVILGDRDTILVAGFAAGSNLDRLVIRRLEISGGAAMSSRKKKKKKDRCPRSHARSKGIAGRKCCKGEKVRSGLAFTRSPEKQSDHVRAESAPQFVG